MTPNIHVNNNNNNNDDDYDDDDQLLTLHEIQTYKNTVINNDANIHNNIHNTIPTYINQNNTDNIHNIYIIKSPYNRNIISKQILWRSCYICLFALIGACINLFSYIDIINNYNNNTIHNGVNLNQDNTIDCNIIYNIDIEYIYYYMLIILLFYTVYISVNILIFLGTYFINININKIIKIIYINNILFTLNNIIRFVQVCILSRFIINNIPILQFTVINNINISHTTLNIHIPLYSELIILDNIFYIYISYLIGLNNGIINLYIN